MRISNLISQTDAEVQGTLLREYERKFAELLEQQKLTNSENKEKRQFFNTLEDEALNDLKGSCRECTLLRSDESSHFRGWIRPVLDVKLYYHQGCYGVEIMIESLFRDRTVSWVRIVNGINQYVTETSDVKTTPQMTPFRDVKVCKNLVTDEIDDHRIQSDYKCTIGLQYLEGKNSVLGIASTW